MPSPLRLSVHRPPAPGSDGLVARLTLRLSSDVRDIESAVELMARHCLAGIETPPPPLAFRLRVVLAEALANAIVRGNGEDREKLVDLSVELWTDRIVIVVTDEGPGFDPSLVPEPTVPDRLERVGGRGLYLIRKLVDDVHFNGRGNVICMTLRRR